MEKKRLLVYSQYYYPEIASTAQIYTDLCEGLVNEFDITVICAVPCYTGKVEDRYKSKKFYFEEYRGVKVVRVSVPEFDKLNKLSRIKHIIKYYFNSKAATKKVGSFDYVLTMSQPPILGGMLGVYGKKKKKAKLIYNIQDYNPEQTLAVKYSNNKLILKVMMYLDKKTCRKSDKVIVVGRDMVETMVQRFKKNPQKMPDTVVINNWMDQNDVYPLQNDNKGVVEFKKKYGLENKFVVMYSGNIGLYYDLENIMKVIAEFKERKDVVFAFVGEGALRQKLRDYVSENQLSNIVFIPYQDKKDLVYSLNAADIHWCVNAKGIKGVSCPSKYYGIAACGKPVLGVLEEGTEVRTIIDSVNGGFCCEPGDYAGLSENIGKILELSNEQLEQMGKNNYNYFLMELTKEKAINRYLKEINF